MRSVHALAVAALLLLPACDLASAAGEPKQGGIFRVYHRDSPGSASIHEGATYSVNIPFMPIFNNLVVFKQDVPQNSFGIFPQVKDQPVLADGVLNFFAGYYLFLADCAREAMRVAGRTVG